MRRGSTGAGVSAQAGPRRRDGAGDDGLIVRPWRTISEMRDRRTAAGPDNVAGRPLGRERSGGDAQDELAAGTTALAPGVGPAGLRQRKDLLDAYGHLAGVDQFTDPGQGRAVGFDQEGARPQALGGRRVAQFG